MCRINQVQVREGLCVQQLGYANTYTIKWRATIGQYSRQLCLLDNSHWSADGTLAAGRKIMQMTVKEIPYIFH